MMRKTAFMKTYRDYLPKTPKINIAIKNIDALNHATYLEIDKHAKPQYFDNPKFNEAKAIEKKEEQMNDDPMLKTAPKAAINKIFEFIKTLEKEKQKPAQAAILKKVQKFSELNGVKMAR
jgi:D-mannonate dehydratase